MGRTFRNDLLVGCKEALKGVWGVGGVRGEAKWWGRKGQEESESE